MSNGIAIPDFARDQPERWADAVDYALQLSARLEPDGHPHMRMVLAMARVAFNDPCFPPQPRHTLVQRLFGRR